MPNITILIKKQSNSMIFCFKFHTKSTNFAVDFMPLYVNGNGTSIVKYNNTGLTNGVTTTAAGLYTWRTDTGSPVDPTFVHSFIVGDLA